MLRGAAKLIAQYNSRLATQFGNIHYVHVLSASYLSVVALTATESVPREDHPHYITYDILRIPAVIASGHLNRDIPRQQYLRTL